MESTLLVHSIFLSVQGEGPFVGYPAVFVRFATCNFSCPRCDTEFRKAATQRSAAYIIDRVKSLAGDSVSLVVLTGGEPMAQDIAQLVQDLVEVMPYVQIETNGSLYVPKLPYGSSHLTIVCSPKAHFISPALEPYIDAYKYVLAAGEIDPRDGLPDRCFNGSHLPPARPRSCQTGSDPTVYVQPADDHNPVKNSANTMAALTVAQKHGYVLSLQIHKYLGID